MSRPLHNRPPTPLFGTLSRSECLELLGTGSIGRVVVTLGSGSESLPVIRPVNYAFDTASQSVVFRSVVGSKLYGLLHSARAWFEVDYIDVPGRRGWSVIIGGATEPVVDAAELHRLEHLGLRSWVAGDDTRWIRIRARTVSGRVVTAE